MSYITKCDRCTKTDSVRYRYMVPTKWVNIGIKVKTVNGEHVKWYQFCPLCSEHLQITNEPSEQETSAEKLISILESIIEEKIDEAHE